MFRQSRTRLGMLLEVLDLTLDLRRQPTVVGVEEGDQPTGGSRDPALRAGPDPAFVRRSTRTPSNRSAISAESSVEPSSTTNSSSTGRVWALMLSRQSARYAAPLNTGTTALITRDASRVLRERPRPDRSLRAGLTLRPTRVAHVVHRVEHDDVRQVGVLLEPRWQVGRVEATGSPIASTDSVVSSTSCAERIAHERVDAGARLGSSSTGRRDDDLADGRRRARSTRLRRHRPRSRAGRQVGGAPRRRRSRRRSAGDSLGTVAR